MKLQYAAGIDIGTQGTKAALFSLDGRKVSETFERSRLITGDRERCARMPATFTVLF